MEKEESSFIFSKGTSLQWSSTDPIGQQPISISDYIGIARSVLMNLPLLFKKAWFCSGFITCTVGFLCISKWYWVRTRLILLNTVSNLYQSLGLQFLSHLHFIEQFFIVWSLHQSTRAWITFMTYNFLAYLLSIVIFVSRYHFVWLPT